MYAFFMDTLYIFDKRYIPQYFAPLDVFWPAQGASQLSHCLVEWNVFEELHPGEKNTYGDSRLEHGAEVAQGSEVSVVIRILNTDELF